VEVDGEVGTGQGRVEGGQWSGVDDLVDAAAEPGQRLEGAGAGEDATVPGEGVGQRSQGRDRSQEVTEAESPQDDQQRPGVSGRNG
jgi:hypothetical protein